MNTEVYAAPGVSALEHAIERQGQRPSAILLACTAAALADSLGLVLGQQLLDGRLLMVAERHCQR